MSGKEIYGAYRRSFNDAGRKRGHQAGQPRWEDLKPWVRRVWERAASGLSGPVRDDPVPPDDDDAIHIASPWDARISLCGNWHRRNLQPFEKTTIDEGSACWTCCMAWKAIGELVTARSPGAVSQGEEDRS